MTFSIKLNSKGLSNMVAIDFEGLEYVDISKKIRKAVSFAKDPSTLVYLFDSLAEIPAEVLTKIDVNKEVLDGGVERLVEEFREFRLEKSLIKTIKFKAEIINTYDYDQLRTFYKICNYFMQLDLTPDLREPLRYNKYKTLDFSNISQLIIKEVGMTELPSWLKDLRNLRTLDLKNNELYAIGEGEWFPSSLRHLSLKRNRLISFDLSIANHVTYLDLSHNQLEAFKLGEDCQLVELNLESNTIGEFSFGGNQTISRLNLKSNQLYAFDLGDNNSLTELNLSRNWLNNFEMGSNNSLKALRLQENSLQNFSSGLNNSLSYLGLGYNFYLA
jgi:Leucine-rich repeat (LRR) protein